MRILATFAFSALAAWGQMTVAPTSAPVGAARGEDYGGYNITNSVELGYRLHNVNGNSQQYRSDVNFGNGVRLLAARFTAHSKEGHGGYFDELLLDTQGLGNDPYQASSFRLQKNKLYRYDLLWRQNDYYSPAFTVAGGQHFLGTTRGLQDHNLVLLPQAPIRLHLGFSRWGQSGAGLSTVQLFDTRGDEFVLGRDVRRSQTEYRLGFDVDVAGFKLTVMRGWENFKDDTRLTTGDLVGNNPLDRTAIQNFRRDEPYHGSTDSWRMNMLVDKFQAFTVNARFGWADSSRDFIFDELALGTDRLGATRNRQIFVFGDARRPVSSGSLTTTFYPSSRFTIVNHTSFHHTRMEGNGSYREFLTGSPEFAELDFSFLGIRTIATATDVNVRTTKAVTLFAGHHFSTRRIRSTEQATFGGIADTVSAEQTNQLNAGRAGVRVRGWRGLSLVLDGEIGRADRPIYTTSERNYHALSARANWRSRRFSATALARTNYNTNSTSLFSHSARSRNYSLDASWNPQTWIGFDASYSKLHLDTLSGIAYFLNGALTPDRSTYLSNIHSGTLGIRTSLISRVDLFAGYTRVQDTGGSVPGGAANPYNPATLSLGYQSWPLVYDSPLARVSVRLHERLRWNAGYQFYHHDQERLRVQNYRAHTGYTSLIWSF